MSKIGEGEIDNQWFKWVKMTIVPRPSQESLKTIPLLTSVEMENGKWEMENYFLRWRLEQSTERRNKKPLFLGENGGLGGLPRLVAYANQNAPRCLSERRTKLLLEQKD